MGLSIGNFLWALVLFINAIAILNEERFLAKIGWGRPYEGYEQHGSAKKQLIHLISAVRTLLRIPLIIINSFLIIYELILG